MESMSRSREYLVLQQNRFLEDEVIKGFNAKLGRIIQYAIPIAILHSSSGEITLKYDEETTKALNEVKTAIAEYIEIIIHASQN